jgi:hypothetical protein
VTGFLTIGEASTALDLTPRQLRYLGLGAVASADGSRLYDAEGLALLLLFAQVAQRFAAWEVPAWKARAALLYCEPEIRAAFARRETAAALVLDSWRGIARVAPTVPPGAEVVLLRPALVSARAIIAETRKAQPEVWTGREFTETPELLTV